MKSRGNSMMKTLRISFSLKNTYRINSIYYGFKQIPVIKKILPESLYAAGGFKLVVSILSVIWEIISGFIGKFIYIFFMIFMVSALFFKDTAEGGICKYTVFPHVYRGFVKYLYI